MKTAGRSRIQLWLAVACATCLLVQSAGATLLFSEAFNYTQKSGLTGNVNPGNNTAWSGGNAGLYITSGALSYPGLPDQGGNELSISNGIAGSSVNTFANITSGQIYYSYLLDVTTVDGANDYFTALNSGTVPPGGSNDAIATYLYSNGKIGLRTAGESTVTSANALSSNTTNFVVLEYNFATSTAYLYLNPTPGASQPAPTLTLAGSGSVTAIDDVGFKAQSTTGYYVADNLLIGTAWGDVTPATVPEPSAWALVGTGLALMFSVVRRRRG